MTGSLPSGASTLTTRQSRPAGHCSASPPRKPSIPREARGLDLAADPAADARYGRQRAYPGSTMAILRYTALRLLVFIVVAALLWIVGLRDYWLLLFAVLLSGIVSLFVLSGSRDQLSSALVNRQERIKQRRAERMAAEDEWNDEVGRTGEHSGTEGPADRG